MSKERFVYQNKSVIVVHAYYKSYLHILYIFCLYNTYPYFLL